MADDDRIGLCCGRSVAPNSCYLLPSSPIFSLLSHSDRRKQNHQDVANAINAAGQFLPRRSYSSSIDRFDFPGQSSVADSRRTCPIKSSLMLSNPIITGLRCCRYSGLPRIIGRRANVDDGDAEMSSVAEAQSLLANACSFADRTTAGRPTCSPSEF